VCVPIISGKVPFSNLKGEREREREREIDRESVCVSVCAYPIHI
jgi:hypothetical protein